MTAKKRVEHVYIKRCKLLFLCVKVLHSSWYIMIYESLYQQRLQDVGRYIKLIGILLEIAHSQPIVSDGFPKL